MLQKAEKEIICVAEFKAKPGKEDRLVESIQNLIPATRREPGNIRYEMHQAIDDPRTITLIEKYASREAFDEHCSTPYLKEFLDHVVPALTEKSVVTLYKEVLA
jgi:quinol monooxygenase YgiN